MERHSNRRTRLAKSFVAFLLAFVCVVTVIPQDIVWTNAISEAVAAVEMPEVVQKSDNKTLWANGSAYADNNSYDAIKWEKKDGKYYLYLPTSADMDNLILWHKFKKLSYDGKEIKSGEPTNYFRKCGEYKLVGDNVEYKLVVMKSNNINTMFISTSKGNLDAVNKSGDHSVSDSGTILCVDEKGKTSTCDLDSIKGRGNTSWRYAQQVAKKYPYALKVHVLNEKGKKKGAKILGMDAAKKWVLLANALDQSLLRNKFVLDLAHDAGLAYTPDCRLADVYQNGVYIGNYLVTNKIEVNDTSVDITNLEDATTEANGGKEAESFSRGGSTGSCSANSYKYVNVEKDPADITGGYLLEFELTDADRYPAEVSGFVTSKRQPIVVKSPEYASKRQVEYIRDYFQKAENAAYNYGSTDYMNYIDVKTAAEMYIIEELTKDTDAVATSFYCYKDVNGKLCFGPSWDFDWALGAYGGATSTDDDYVANKKIYKASEINFMGALYRHPEFKAEVAKIWKERFIPLLQVTLGNAEATTDRVRSIYTYRDLINDSANMNFKKFNLLGHADWGAVPISSTFNGNVDYVNNFIFGRVKHMNKVLGGSLGDTTRTVYFDTSNTGWNTVVAYAWNNDDPGTEYVASRIEGTNIFKVVIYGDFEKVLFKNTVGTWNLQTQDLTMPSNNTSCYKPDNGANKANGYWYQYSAPVTVSPTPTSPVEPTPGTGTKLYFNSKNTGINDVYAYVWNSPEDHKIFAPSKKEGTISTFEINGNYQKVLFKEIFSETEWKWQTVDLDMPAANSTKRCFVPNSSANKTSGNWEDYTPATTAPVPATTKPAPVTPQPGTIQVTYIRAENDKWNNVNVHYKVNGSWTIVPGVAMSKVNNTTFTYNIQLNGSKEAIVCFNNNNGKWDSCGESNYKLDGNKGSIFVVDQSNGGKITVSGDPVGTVKPTATPTTTPFSPSPIFYDWQATISADKESPQYLGTEIKLVGSTSGILNTVFSSKSTLEIKDEKGNVVVKHDGTKDTKYTWMPDKAGKYTITYSVDLTGGVCGTDRCPKYNTASATMTYEVKDSQVVKDNCTVYYQNKSWSTANMHYKLNGAWTGIPGIQMTKVEYGLWKIDVKLNGAKELIVCFNNGDKWDSANGNNYTISPANGKTVIVENGKVSPYTPVVTPTPETKTIYFCDAHTNKWAHACAYVWNSTVDNNCFEPVEITKIDSKIVYKFEITGSYTGVLFKNTSGKDNWDLKTVDEKMPSDSKTMYYYGASATGKEINTWVEPFVVPTSTPVVTATPNPTKTPVVTSTPVTSNKLVLTYKRSSSTSWKNAYIHYKLNGVWTTSPGTKMTKKSNGVWEITIDMGKAKDIVVCFNNGSGSWDSNGSKNYSLTNGTYVIDQSKKTVTKK